MRINNVAHSLMQAILRQGHNTASVSKKIALQGKYLIVNGDDLGRDDATDNAIVAAYKNGILTSTSAFINLQDSVQRVQKIHHENPELPIGLHLNLTLGTPVANQREVPHLTDTSGHFFDIDDIIKYLPDMPVEQVQKEFLAQADLFLSSGVPMDHISYHHHVPAIYTPFFKIVREMAQRYQVPLRNPVPISIYKLMQLNGNGGGGSAGIKKLLRFAVTQPFKALPLVKKIGPQALIDQESLLLAENCISTHWFIDSFYANASVENFLAILEQLPEGTSEIMCHPGIEGELEVLIHPSVKNAVEAQGIRLVSWNQLKNDSIHGKTENFNRTI